MSSDCAFNYRLIDIFADNEKWTAPSENNRRKKIIIKKKKKAFKRPEESSKQYKNESGF